MAYRELEEQGASLREIATSSNGHAEFFGRSPEGLSAPGYYTISLAGNSFLVIPKATEFSLLCPKAKPVTTAFKATEFLVWLAVSACVLLANDDVGINTFAIFADASAGAQQ